MRNEVCWRHITGYTAPQLVEIFNDSDFISHATVLRNAADFLTETTSLQSMDRNSIDIRTPAQKLLTHLEHHPTHVLRNTKTSRLLGADAMNNLRLTRLETAGETKFKCDLNYFELEQGRATGVRWRPEIVIPHEIIISYELPLGEIRDISATRISDTTWITYNQTQFIRSSHNSTPFENEEFPIIDTKRTKPMLGTLLLGLDPGMRLEKTGNLNY